MQQNLVIVSSSHRVTARLKHHIPSLSGGWSRTLVSKAREFFAEDAQSNREIAYLCGARVAEKSTKERTARAKA